MPDCNLPPSSSATSETSLDAPAELEAERRCLIDNIAFLIVRRHRRRQLDEGDPDKPGVHRSSRAGKDEKRPIQLGGAAAGRMSSITRTQP